MHLYVFRMFINDSTWPVQMDGGRSAVGDVLGNKSLRVLCKQSFIVYRSDGDVDR